MADMQNDVIFWSWLAGLADGEGCFLIGKQGGFVHARFTIHLRADDWRVLREIHERSGIGTLTRQQTPSSDLRNSNPAVRWSVAAIDDCVKLVAGFSLSGLRSKKARDFAIWKEAVALIDQFGGGAKSPVYGRLLELADTIRDVKRFAPLSTGDAAEVERLFDEGRRKRHERSAAYWQSDRAIGERQQRQQRYAKLTQAQIDDIIRRVAAGERRVAIAEEYGVTVSLVGNFVRGKYMRRDGTLAPAEARVLPKATTPEFWKTEQGQAAQRARAIQRSKVTQKQIDEIVRRVRDGETQNAVASDFGISRPLVAKFLRGDYVKRE